MDFMSTVKGSLLEGFYPEGWDMKKIDECCEKGVKREDFWNKKFKPIACEDVAEFDTLMGHEIAMQIKKAREKGEKLAMILPVGPMGMYKWASYFLKEWNVSCDHVYTFNMDEWADADGNTLPSTEPASFEYSMKQAFFNKLGKLTVPESQRNFATKFADLSGKDCKTESRRSKIGFDLRHWQNVPHCVLGASFRQRVRNS